MNELNTLILESYSDLVDSRLELLLEGKEKPVQDLTDAMRYSTMIGGRIWYGSVVMLLKPLSMSEPMEHCGSMMPATRSLARTRPCWPVTPSRPVPLRWRPERTFPRKRPWKP